MEKPISKAAQKRADTDKMATKVAAVMAEAQQAAVAAYENFMESAPRSPEGRIDDDWGVANVYVWAPSYPFRKAMVNASFMRNTGYRARWSIGPFKSDGTSSTVYAG